MDSSRRRKRAPDPRPSVLPPYLPSPVHSRYARAPSPPRPIQKRPRPGGLPMLSTAKESMTPTLAPAAPRQGVKPPPRTLTDVTAPFTEFAPRTPEEKADAAKLCGAPRLSCMALAVARLHAQRGQILDLSRVADDHVYTLFGTPGLTPTLLAQIEACNPLRVNVMEALWARLVADKFERKTLPEGIACWREYFEKLTKEKEVELQRSSERLRRWYSDGDKERQKRTIETTRRIRVIGNRKKRPSGGGTSLGVQSRISRLREEVRREKKRR